MSIQSALVIGAGSGVGQATAGALTAAGARVLAAGRERDATDPAQVAALVAEAEPDLVVVAAGTRPRMASIEEQTWESFSAPWNVDVRIAFEVGRAALARPLRPGSTVLIMSSGAGLDGSPLSGGYAGAKRTQMFLARYLQRESDARGLGIRFVALAPRQFIAGTLENSQDNMRRWLMDTQHVKPGTAMPQLGVREQDARDMAGYLATLR